MKNKRIFFGFSIEKILTNKLIEFRSIFTNTQSQIPVNKWVKAKNFHLTLLFIGSISENKIPIICKNIENLISETSSFILYPKYFTTFPPINSSMIWLEFIRSEPFEKLVIELNKSILKTQPKEIIIPHITLTRFKHETITDRSWPIDPNLKLSCGKVHLYESVLTPDGPIYSIIKTFSLKG